MEIVPSTLIPISWAAPLSSEQARMALPIFVWLMKAVSPAMITTQVKIVTMVTKEMVSCPSNSCKLLRTVSAPSAAVPFRTKNAGNIFGVELHSSSALFCRK